MMIPTVLDWTSQLMTPRVSNNFIRFTTGFLAGVGLALAIISLKWLLFSL